MAEKSRWDILQEAVNARPIVDSDKNPEIRIGRPPGELKAMLHISVLPAVAEKVRILARASRMSQGQVFELAFGELEKGIAEGKISLYEDPFLKQPEGDRAVREFSAQPNADGSPKSAQQIIEFMERGKDIS